ncbi:MAG: hypothetical protein KBT05_04415 [Bacteroidales bacterium]|nr:hypothetical protein [Candidatus Cryptobacteroides caccocaballi]
MKKRLTRICAWGLAVLLGSISAACSSASKVSRTPESESDDDSGSGALAPRDTVVRRKDGPGSIMLLYGIRPTDYRQMEQDKTE